MRDERGPEPTDAARGDSTPRAHPRASPSLTDPDWRALFAEIPDYVLIVDRDGVVQYVNRAPEGFDAAQVPGTRLESYTFPQHRDRTREAVIAVFDRGTPLTIEIDAAGALGSRASYSVRLGPLHHDGKAIAVALVIRDITEQKRFETTIRGLVLGTAPSTGDDFFQTAIQGLAAALQVRVAFASELVDAAESTARTLAIWVGQDYQDNFEYPLAGSGAAAALRDGICKLSGTFRERFPDAPLLTLGIRSLLILPFFDADKRPIGLIGIADDGPFVDPDRAESVLRVFAARAGAELGRKHAERALRDSEQRFRSIFENGPLGIAIVSLEGRFLSVNDRLCQMYGYPADELLGIGIRDITHPDDRELHSRAAERLFRGETPLLKLEFRSLRKDGTIRWLALTATLIRDGTGQPRYGLGIVDDFTERKLAEIAAAQARDEAIAAARAKDEFLANISHELRTPMSGVVGAIDLLLGTALAPEQAEYAQIAQSCANVQMALIGDVLDLARIDAGHFALVREVVDLWALVDEVTTALSSVAQQKHVTLDVDWSPDVPRRIVADPRCIRQPLMNLVGNAIKFTPAGAVHIAVACRAVTDAWVELTFAISDTGIGIPLDKQAVIFDRFTQIDTSMTRAYGGAGLGLAITKQLVKAAGGRIGVESLPGEGATFWFTLEATVAASSGESRPAVENTIHRPCYANYPPNGLCVLVAEDQPLPRLLAVRRLERLGCQVETATDGNMALEMANRKAYDLIFMDCQMPGLDGFQVTTAIRQRDKGMRHVPIIAMTAFEAPGDRDRCLANGMDDFLPKSITLDQLRATINRWRPAAPVPVPAKD
jgi:PAS domain S-box-containing protein